MAGVGGPGKEAFFSQAHEPGRLDLPYVPAAQRPSKQELNTASLKIRAEKSCWLVCWDGGVAGEWVGDSLAEGEGVLFGWRGEGKCQRMGAMGGWFPACGKIW